MKTKLTLSIDPELAAFAHQEAKRTGKSVSALFSDTMRRRQTSEKSNRPSIDDVYGSLAGLDIDTSKEGIRELYAEKYLG